MFGALATVGALLTLWLAVRLRNRVIYPLYTLSNLLEALREGDFSLRGSRARRDDPIGEVIWEINTLSQTLRDQRHRVEETSALLSKVIGATDIAIFTFDSERRLRLINPAGERLLARQAENLLGRTAARLARGGRRRPRCHRRAGRGADAVHGRLHGARAPAAAAQERDRTRRTRAARRAPRAEPAGAGPRRARAAPARGPRPDRAGADQPRQECGRRDAARGGRRRRALASRSGYRAHRNRR